MKETFFGTIGSYTNLGLIEQSVKIVPGQPKTKYIDLPYADGSVDFSEPNGVVFFRDTAIEWTYAILPSDDYFVKITQVKAALNGSRLEIHLDGDSDYHYEGRISVASHESDGLLGKIKLKSICYPFKIKNNPTTLTFPVTLDDTTHFLTFDSPRAKLVSASSENGSRIELTIKINGTVVYSLSFDGTVDFAYKMIKGQTNSITVEGGSNNIILKIVEETL